MPAVSVIMNIYNGAATLREALQSVLNQTCTDWELIVWDDRSTDASAQIVASFHDPRVHYHLAEQQTSLGEARNSAIRQASGEWLAFLDQDDVWLPRKLELQRALADSPEVGIIYGRTLAFSPDGSQRDHDYFHEFSPLPEGDIFRELLGRGCFIAMSSALLRRSAVCDAGRLPPDIRIAPDYFLYLTVSHKYRARAVEEVVCRYRLHPGSMTRVFRRESLEESLRLVGQWEHQVDAKTYKARKTRLETALAVEEMHSPSDFAQGLRRLVRDGSMLWLAGRPIVHLWRRVRRTIQRPYWTRSAEPS
jgi:glycosyltransferase involved in cell wall biosynthesis